MSVFNDVLFSPMLSAGFFAEESEPLESIESTPDFTLDLPDLFPPYEECFSLPLLP